MIRKSYPWSPKETMFHDRLLETWKAEMWNQFNAFPETDRAIAMHAAYNLLRETITAAFPDQELAREACLKDLGFTFERILDWKKRANDASKPASA